MNKKLKGLITIGLISCMMNSTTYNYKCNAINFDDENRNNGKARQDITKEINMNASKMIKEPRECYKRIAYITIDDGPSKYTDQIISILDKYNAKATFFMIDANMRRYPQQVNNIIEKGHTPGFHSVSHDIHQLYKTTTSAKEEFDINSETFYEITGTNTKVIRLPYGSKPYTPRESYEALVEAGYKMWDWGIDTQDWRATTIQIIDNVETYSKNKNEVVILMHEKYQTVQALDEVLKYLTDEGYVLLPISQEQEPQNFWIGNLR